MKKSLDQNRIGNIPTLYDICGVNIFKQTVQQQFNKDDEYKLSIVDQSVINNINNYILESTNAADLLKYFSIVFALLKIHDGNSNYNIKVINEIGQHIIQLNSMRKVRKYINTANKLRKIKN